MPHLVRKFAQIESQLMGLSEGLLNILEVTIQGLLESQPLDLPRIREAQTTLYERAVDIEEACLGTIALHVPVAVQLRQVVSYLKTKEDFVRINDLISAVIQTHEKLLKLPAIDPPCDMPLMTGTAQDMLRISLRAFKDRDADTARVVREMDDVIDDAHEQMYANVESRLTVDTTQIGQLLLYQDISRHLERIADQATRISKTVIYVAEGQIVRHEGAAKGPSSTD